MFSYCCCQVYWFILQSQIYCENRSVLFLSSNIVFFLSRSSILFFFCLSFLSSFHSRFPFWADSLFAQHICVFGPILLLVTGHVLLFLRTANGLVDGWSSWVKLLSDWVYCVSFLCGGLVPWQVGKWLAGQIDPSKTFLKFYFGEWVCGCLFSRDSDALVLRCDRSLTEALGDQWHICILTCETWNTYFPALRGLWELFSFHLVCQARGVPASSRTVYTSKLKGMLSISDALFLPGSVFFGVRPTNGGYFVLHKPWFSSAQWNTVF